jgi:hypothetical protein
MLRSGVTIVETIIAAVDTTAIAATIDPPIIAAAATSMIIAEEEEDTAATAIESVATSDPPIGITTIATGGALTMTATGGMIAPAAKIEIVRCEGGRRSGKSRRRGGRNGLERRVLRLLGS